MMLVTGLHEVIECSRICVPSEEQVEWSELCDCWEVVTEP